MEADDIDADTVIVDLSYLETMLAEAPPPPAPRWPTFEEEIAAEPLPEPRDLGGVVASAEYVRREIVALRRERRRRGMAV